jgi:hypothetical protein
MPLKKTKSAPGRAEHTYCEAAHGTVRLEGLPQYRE